MAKTSKTQVEQDVVKVLDALEQHSKESIDEIAKSCGFSRQKVSRIIKNLERNKVIWGYPPITENNGGNDKHFTLLVKRTLVPIDNEIRKEVNSDRIDNRIPGLVKMENIYTTNGDICDFIFTFYAPDLISAKKFVESLFKRHSDHIKHYYLLETMVHMRKQGLKNPQMKDLVDYI
jgi:DNA-binding Lrp family transcriptional regulator